MTRTGTAKGQADEALFALPFAFTERFLPFADGFRPGIRTPTELNDGLSSGWPRLRRAWASLTVIDSSSTASFTKYIRVWRMTSVRISRVQSSKFARASQTSSLGNLVVWAISFCVRAPQRIASRTRSAGDNFLSIRAIRLGEKPSFASIVTRDRLVAAVVPCLMRALLYSLRACRLRAIFWRMQRLQ